MKRICQILLLLGIVLTSWAQGNNALERVVATLPSAERRLWTMFAEAQMDSAQIAAATGIAIRSVSTMLSSARHHIVESLKKGGAL